MFHFTEMTQLTNFNAPFSNQNSNFHQFYNFDSHQHQPLEGMHYFVREPNGKRPFPTEFELVSTYK